MDTIQILGTGRLNWCPSERRSDRYGAVGLFSEEHAQDGDSMPLETAGALGHRGTLRAVVTETRASGHIGDMFHGFGPGGAVVGDVVTLGQGVLFVEDDYGPRVGVLPDDGRDHFWMEPGALYRCHNQTVRLEFVAEVQS